MFKDYNLNYHYVTKHLEKYKNLTDAEWKQTFEPLLAKLLWSMVLEYRT